MSVNTEELRRLHEDWVRFEGAIHGGTGTGLTNCYSYQDGHHEFGNWLIEDFVPMLDAIDAQAATIKAQAEEIERRICWKRADEERPACECYDCGMPYHDFPDMVIPDDLWEKINPTHHEGAGLLCPTCIAKRLDMLGLWYDHIGIVKQMYADNTRLTAENAALRERCTAAEMDLQEMAERTETCTCCAKYRECGGNDPEGCWEWRELRRGPKPAAEELPFVTEAMPEGDAKC